MGIPIRLLCALSICAITSACALPTALPASASLNPPNGKIVVVGKVVLDPPFSPDFEQRTHWNIIGDGSILNRVMIATADSPQAIEIGRFRGNDWQAFIDAHWGEYFVAVVPRSTRYINGLATPLDLQQQDYLWFPGGMVLRPPPEGDVVYVGTLQYRRNDFNQIINIEVVDEKQEALAELKSRFGQTPEYLTNALWVHQLPWENID